MGSRFAIRRRPVRGSVVRTLMSGPPSPHAAGMRSGSACAKAPNTQDCSRIAPRLRMPTAAGYFGFTSDPSGMMQRVGRSSPEFSSTDRSIVYIA